MIKDINLRVTPAVAAQHKLLRNAVADAAGPNGVNINDFRIIRRSIDARRKDVKINLRVRIACGEDAEVKAIVTPIGYPDVSKAEHSLVIVGFGPAGLFASLKAIELGIRPIVLERGKDVDERRKDIAAISRDGVVNPNSNYCFGEGGAGAYSDGKLFTRSKKRGDVIGILNTLVIHGASEDIMVDSHPHIGSDRLPNIIRNMRETILRSGGEVHFNTRITDVLVEEGTAVGVVAEDGSRFEGAVALATGHSAHDIYHMLHNKGITVEAKGLAMGVRLEHPQHLIDRIQYHNPEGRGKWLPAAEYSFVEQVDGRGVYSFCMCPGGVVVPAVSASGESVVNGMSSSSRGSRWANSAMVVELRPGDFPEYSQYGPLEMLHLQEDLEKNYFDASGKTLKAPAQRMKDFVHGRISGSLPKSSYAPGLLSLPVHFLLPEFISARLRKGFEKMGRRSKGFLTNEAVLIGLESRTSSPVRIPRDNITMQHPEIVNLYPVGEGAGHAGGIVSAAMDGVRCAEAFARTLDI